MVIVTLSQLVEEKISLLKELMNHKNNRPEVNNTYQTQIDTIRSIDDYDIENVESIILQKKDLLKNRDAEETERLLAEIDALEWLEAQIVVLTLGVNSNNKNGPITTALGI